MITLGHLALLRPWWLLGIPIVVAFYLFTRSRAGTLAAWERASDPHLLAAMVARGAAATAGRGRAPAILATLLLGLIALSGPAIRRTDANRLRNLDATVLVMDASARMADSGKLHDAAAAAHDVLAHLGARQAGLIVYAGEAYVASGLTDFSGAIDTDLFALDDTTVPDPGSRPDRALELAGSMLDEAHIISGDVILVSAGGGLDGTRAIRAAAALRSAGRRVYVMSAATEASSRALAAVAAAGGGFVVSVDHPGRLIDVLANRSIDNTGSSAINALSWQDLGRLVLAFAALPLLFGFRKVADAADVRNADA